MTKDQQIEAVARAIWTMYGESFPHRTYEDLPLHKLNAIKAYAKAAIEAASVVEFGNEEAPRYTTRRLREEIRKAEERGRLYEREAALSTDAEPVGWHIPGSTAITKDKDVTDRWRLGPSTVIDPVYDRPQQPAPSVAVKALKAAEEELSRIDCIPMVTETKDPYAQLELAKVYAGRGAHEARTALAALSAQVQDVSETEADIVERMVKSIRDPFPSANLSVSRGIDGWRELMRDALRAAAPAAKLEGKP